MGSRTWIKSRCLGVIAILLLLFAGGAQPARAQVAESYWGVTCAGSVNGLSCRVIQSLQMTNSGIVSLAVYPSAETGVPMMLILTPLGVYLPSGVIVQFGKVKPKAVAFQNCDNTGCLAEYVLTDDEFAALQEAQGFSVSVRDLAKQLITVPVSGAAFPQAWAKLQ